MTNGHIMMDISPGHSGKVLSAKFMGDTTRVVSGSHDRTLKVEKSNLLGLIGILPQYLRCGI